MDKTINVRMFSVLHNGIVNAGFKTGLTRIQTLSLLDREYEMEPDLIIRLERLDVVGQFYAGELIRLQISNLPSEAQRGIPVRALGVTSIGHSTVFVYDPTTSILALQLARNGISSARTKLYVEHMSGNKQLTFYPFLMLVLSLRWNMVVFAH